MQEVREVKSDEDIKIISSIGSSENAPEFNAKTIDKLISKRNIYVVSDMEGYCPDFLRNRYKFELESVIWHVIRQGE